MDKTNQEQVIELLDLFEEMSVRDSRYEEKMRQRVKKKIISLIPSDEIFYNHAKYGA